MYPGMWSIRFWVQWESSEARGQGELGSGLGTITQEMAEGYLSTRLEFLVSSKVESSIIVLVLLVIKPLLSWTLRSVSVQPNKILCNTVCFILMWARLCARCWGFSDKKQGRQAYEKVIRIQSAKHCDR